METIVATGLFALCMILMAVGVIVGGKPVKKGCGTDPVTGERLGYCVCEAEGKEPCCGRDEEECSFGRETAGNNRDHGSTHS
jgi:hypothetical protein